MPGFEESKLKSELKRFLEERGRGLKGQAKAEHDKVMRLLYSDDTIIPDDSPKNKAKSEKQILELLRVYEDYIAQHQFKSPRPK